MKFIPNAVVSSYTTGVHVLHNNYTVKIYTEIDIHGTFDMYAVIKYYS